MCRSWEKWNAANISTRTRNSWIRSTGRCRMRRFKIFGDSTRIKILYVLFESEMCVCDIAQLLNMTQSAISHQLRALKQSKLVKYRREGKTVFYSLADGHVRTILGQGMEHVAE